MKNPGSHENVKSAVAVLALAAALLAMIGIFASSASFVTSPSISPTGPDTTDSLICSWNATSDTTEIQVLWTNGSQNVTINATGQTTAILNASFTTRGHNWYCNVTLYNATANTSSSTNVTITNAVPSVPYMHNSTANNVSNTTTVYEDISNSFTLYSTDPDGDTVSYVLLDSLPSGASFTGSTGAFSWTPTQSSSNETLEFIARDNQTPSGISSTGKQVLFAITYINDDPEFSPALQDKSINEGQVFNYPITGSDEESNHPLNFTIISTTPSISLTLTQTSNTTATIMLSGNATAGYTSEGNYTINVSITDSLNASTDMAFVLRINNSNTPPELLSAAQSGSWAQGSAFSILVYANDSDANESLNITAATYNCTGYSNLWNNTLTTITYNTTYTNATGNLTIGLLTNDHVICRYINITVRDDEGDEDSEVVFLNITNTNDPPIVQVLSSHSSNTGGNNISSLIGYSNTEFIYYVNATDIDTSTYAGDTLTYTEDSPIFSINSSNGLISFSPNISDIGFHSINITATDSGGLNGNRTMNLTVLNNTVPVLQALGSITCFEDIACFVYINASDEDGDNLTFTSSNSTAFPITQNASSDPTWNAYLNSTYSQSLVGSYTINVTVTDTKGAYDYETIAFTVNNTNDAPALQSITVPTAVESHALQFTAYATDEDYNLSNTYENVTFNVTNITGSLIFNITTTFNSSNNQTYGLVSITLQVGSAGNYSYNFTATDYYGSQSTLVVNFTVYPQVGQPNIEYVRPYLDASDNITLIDGYGNISLYPSRRITINVSENTSVTYDINVTANATQGNMSYNWLVGGSSVSVNKSYTRSFGFLSAGTENVTVVVQNSYLENTSFEWNTAVTDVNRPPLLYNNFPNLNVSGTTTYNEYFTPLTTRFLDPDDDQDSDGVLDPNETSTLTYNVTECSIATITISGQDLTIDPDEIGTCTVIYTAIDTGGLTLASNSILINATQVSNDTTVIETPVSSSGGGSSRRSPIPIPITREDLKPQAIEIVVPEVITVYENDTVLVPVTVQNTWNSTLKGITINATSESDELEFSFSESQFEELQVGDKRNITMSIGRYRLGEDYKIQVYANVTDPNTDDSAYIYLNTIEQSQAGKDVQTKVTFAQDLLNENPECLELNELLQEAKDRLAAGDSTEALHIVDGVIEGCKYLVSVSKKTVQKPETILEKAVREEYRPFLISFLALAGGTAITMTAIRKRQERLKKKEEAAKAEAGTTDEPSIKPYWPGS